VAFNNATPPQPPPPHFLPSQTPAVPAKPAPSVEGRLNM
tara:strand:+ start:450 stop:566 length:117 start_codon:yes stop_codon:yes gene_type:complete